MVKPTEIFLATMFSGEGHASKHSGLLIASSTDGVTFLNIRDSNQPVFMPASGVRDPMILFWKGQWHLVYAYGPNVSPVLFLARSSDLLHWIPVGTLRLAADRGVSDEGSIRRNGTVNHFVDVPQWIVDPAGNVHLIACIDNDHHWVEIHPLNPDPATWGDQANWSEVTTMTDHRGMALVQGNSFVALRNGTYFVVFNDIESTAYYLRTSVSITSGWSTARQLDLDHSVAKGDSENLVCLAGGALRFYISDGNSLKNMMWFVESANLGEHWTTPKAVHFEGFGAQPINWAQFVRITDPVAISTMIDANQLSKR